MNRDLLSLTDIMMQLDSCKMWLPLLLLSPLVSAKAPHIIVIVSDDQGYNDVSWHNDVVLTPHLADLASRGIILEQHYSQESCSPTRGALLTGRYGKIPLASCRYY